MNGILNQNDQPLLSICIPTYNRAIYLEDTLNSIVNQKSFQTTNDVEVVISDNCSEDNTGIICEKFIKVYGDKIRYFRNRENIKDLNFEKVLSYGRGKFLKLNNDTLIHREDTLDKILEAINQNIINKQILFFSNGTLNKITKSYCNNLDLFVQTVSFYSTWIVCFGIWKDDFESINDFSKNADLQLVQTDILLRLVCSKKLVFVDNSILFDSVPPKSKGGYNIYKVFVTNYLNILKEYKTIKQISPITFFNEKSKLLKSFLIPWTIAIWKDRTQYSFDKSRAFSIVFVKFWSHPLFYPGLLYVFFKILSFKINLKLRKIIFNFRINPF